MIEAKGGGALLVGSGPSSPCRSVRCFCMFLWYELDPTASEIALSDPLQSARFIPPPHVSRSWFASRAV